MKAKEDRILMDPQTPQREVERGGLDLFYIKVDFLSRIYYKRPFTLTEWGTCVARVSLCLSPTLSLSLSLSQKKNCVTV